MVRRRDTPRSTAHGLLVVVLALRRDESRILLPRVAVAELAVVVGSPAPQRAIHTSRASDRGTRSNACPRRRDADLLRRGFVRRRAVAELAGAVGSPAPNSSIRLRRAGVARGGGDPSPRGYRADLLRCGFVRRGSVAELAFSIESPAP